ncbi:unnamed protein product, partial [Brenthis ino]
MNVAMESEILYINDDPCPHQVIPIPGDGSCLFHSLSFSIYGNIESSYDIRRAIVEHVVAHWNEMQLYTCDEHGDPYINADLYSTEMLKSTTYGSLCELKVAAALYPFTFEVYENGRLRGLFGGDPGKPVKRLRFSGSFLGGHYEVLLPYSTSSGLSFNNLLNKHTEHLPKKGGRPKKVNRGRPKTSKLSRSQQIIEAAARYRQNTPEKRKKTLARYSSSHPEVNRASVVRYTASHLEVNRASVERYTASHPEVNRAAVARYTATHPEVNRAAVARYTATHPEKRREVAARYKDLHPDVNLESVRRKRLNEKLQFRLKNLEKFTQALTDKIQDRLEAEKLIKWVVHSRQQALVNFSKTIDRLKDKFKISLEKLNACPPDSILHDKLEAFLGKSEHRNNQEPYYAQEAYKVFETKDKAIAIDNTGKAVFGNVKKHGKGLVWSCNDLCTLDENVIVQLRTIFENLANKTAVQYYALIEQEKLIEFLININTFKPHFPRLRTISREMYQIQSISNLLKDIDASLEKSDVEKIKKYGKQQNIGSIAMENEESHEILEDEVIDKHKAAFKSLKLKCLDTPKTECMSCAVLRDEEVLDLLQNRYAL